MKKYLRIGNVRLDNPFGLAPMAGITDPPFRKLCRRYGASFVCAEMVSANALRYGDKRSHEMLRIRPDEKPVCMQIFGSDPKILAEAARKAEKAGADIVDLNVGCPVPKVVKTGSGMRLMENEKKFEACVANMVKAVRVPVTVKLRLGWRKGENKAKQFARLAERAGAAAVFIHARTVEDRHKGNPDLCGLKQVVKSVKIPVFGNGGVKSREDAVRMMRQTGCAGVLVGQAAMGNPCLFRELTSKRGKTTSRDEMRRKWKVCRKHIALNMRHYGEKCGILRFRKVLAAYLKGIPHAASLRDKAMRIETREEMDQFLNRLEMN